MTQNSQQSQDRNPRWHLWCIRASKLTTDSSSQQLAGVQFAKSQVLAKLGPGQSGPNCLPQKSELEFFTNFFFFIEISSLSNRLLVSHYRFA